MFILDFMLLLKYSSLVLESRVSICCAFHADPNYLYVFFKFYFHAFKVQNCWLLSAVVAKRGSGYVGQTRLFVLNVNVPVEKQATFSSFSLVKMVLYHYQFIE